MAVDELIDVMGRASVAAVLELSARQVAGAPQQGKSTGGRHRLARDATRARLSEGAPVAGEQATRSPEKGAAQDKEVAVPAYEALQQDQPMAERMLQILLNGVSRRRYRRVIPEMADTVGVSRSTVSRETIEASETALKQLLERRFEDLDLLISYIDGMHFGDQCVLAAVGVDVQGRKHVLALRAGATENAAAPILQGWSAYFGWLNSAQHFRKVDYTWKLRRWLQAKHQRRRRAFWKTPLAYWRKAGLYSTQGRIVYAS